MSALIRHCATQLDISRPNYKVLQWKLQGYLKVFRVLQGPFRVVLQRDYECSCVLLRTVECKKRKNSDKVVKSLFVSNFAPNCQPFWKGSVTASRSCFIVGASWVLNTVTVTCSGQHWAVSAQQQRLALSYHGRLTDVIVKMADNSERNSKRTRI